MTTEEKLELDFEDCFDNSTHATGGGYEADTTDKWGFYRTFKEHLKAHIVNFIEWINKEGWEEYDGYDRWINIQEGNKVVEGKVLYDIYLKTKTHT